MEERKYLEEEEVSEEDEVYAEGLIWDAEVVHRCARCDKVLSWYEICWFGRGSNIFSYCPECCVKVVKEQLKGV